MADPYRAAPITPQTEQGLFPAVPEQPQEQFADEREQPVEERPEPGTGKWQPIGSPNYPEAKDHEDGISDLFRVTDEDVGASAEDLSSLTDVNIEEDILDAGPDGTLDDLIDVFEEDIMGDELGQTPSQPRSQRRVVRRSTRPRYTPPTSAGGMRG